MKFYAADDPARRYRTDEMAGNFASFQLPGMSAWSGTTDRREKADASMTNVRFDVLHAPVPNVEVLPLMPIEYDWLDVPSPPIRTHRAGRP